MSELTRALDHGVQFAGTFLEVRFPTRQPRSLSVSSLLRIYPQTNSALLANTLALDKLNEFDGVEVCRACARADAEALENGTQRCLPCRPLSSATSGLGA